MQKENINHTTGERNISSNRDTENYTSKKSSCVNVNKMDGGSHAFLFGTILFILFITEILFGFYMLYEFNRFTTETSKKIVEQNNQIEKLVYIYQGD